MASMNQFDIKALDGGDIVVDVIGLIDEWDGNTLDQFKMRLSEKLYSGDQRVSVNVSSRGGLAFDGLALYSYLAQLENHLTINIIGQASSAATPMLAAADHVTIGETDTVLIHNIRGGTQGDHRDMRKYADILEKVTDVYAAVYRKKTGKSKKELREIMDRDEPMTAKEAKALGLVDEIRKPTKKQVTAMAVKADEDLQKELDELKATVSALQATNADLLAQVSAKAKELEKAQGQNEVYAKQAQSTDEAKIRAEIRAELIAEQEELSDLTARIKAIGIEASGNTASELLRNAIASSGFSVDGRSDEALLAMLEPIEKARASDDTMGEDILARSSEPQAYHWSQFDAVN